MAFRKPLLLVAVLLPLICAEITSAESFSPSEEEGFTAFPAQDDAVSHSTAAGASSELELQWLKSKISYLEKSIEEITGELKQQDVSIEHLEKVIEEKSNVLVTLQSTLQSRQGRASVHVNERFGEVNSRVNGIEKQVAGLKKEIEAQNQKKSELQVRASIAEKKITGMNLKLENLRRINDEQKSKIRNAQRALQVAEEEMLKAMVEASSVAKQLEEVHQAWLPTWLSTHLVHFQSSVIAHWNKYGKPALDLTIQEARKRKSEAEEWMQPHVETFKTKWIPTIEKRCKTFVDDFQPLVQSLSTQAIDYYHVAHGTIKPHVIKVLEVTGPYFQEAKMLTKPYIDQVLRNAKPHVDKALIFLRSYSKKLVRYRKRVTKKVRGYHFLVQATLRETLRSYELTKPLATPRLVWLTASVLMAMPLVALSMILLRKEPTKRRRCSQKTSHTQRRSKRSRQDK